MLQELIADLGASATYDTLIGRYIETTRLSGFLDAYLVDVVKTGRVVTAIFSGEKREMVNYTILAHDNFNDEWELMTLDSANISICDSRPPLSIEHVQNAIAFVKSEEERKRQLELDRVQKENESFEQFAAHIDEHMPHGTKAVIIAERVGNDSNSLEDYYGSISLDCVIVGWSSHNRNLFPESGKRKAESG